MELKYQLLTEKEFNNSFLNLTHKPFFFDYIRGIVLINQDMPHLERIMAAVSACWQFDLLDEKANAIFSREYEIIKDLVGECAAIQFYDVWNKSAAYSRRMKTVQKAAEWIQSVFDKLDLDGWDGLCDLGYDSALVDDGFYQVFKTRATGKSGREYNPYQKTREAIFLYGFLLGKEAR